VKLTTSSPSRAECHEIWEPKPPETLWATPSLLQDSFNFFYIGQKDKKLNARYKEPERCIQNNVGNSRYDVRILNKWYT